MGIGKALMEAVVNNIHKKVSSSLCLGSLEHIGWEFNMLQGEAMYVNSSLEAKGLYEKSGWKVLGKTSVDVSKWGREKPFQTWYMLREVVRSQS